MKSFMAWKNGDMRMLPLAAAVCVAMVCAADGSGLDESQFTSIFNGKDLSGWIGDTNVYWVSEPGILQCGGREGITPVPDDYIMTEKSYADLEGRRQRHRHPLSGRGRHGVFRHRDAARGHRAQDLAASLLHGRILRRLRGA